MICQKRMIGGQSGNQVCRIFVGEGGLGILNRFLLMALKFKAIDVKFTLGKPQTEILTSAGSFGRLVRCIRIRCHTRDKVHSDYL